MGKKKQAAKATLRAISQALVQELFLGKFDQHIEVKNKPILDNPYLLSELERRCPGHDRETYVKEFSVAYRDNR